MLSAPNPFSLILFGASGHLAKLKLYPALYVLLLKKRLPEEFSIVGFSRTELSDDEFRSLVEESVRTHLLEVNEEVLSSLLERCTYHQGQYSETEDYQSLADHLGEIEGSNPWVRLAYFSIPPSVFSEVSQNLCRGGVHSSQNPLRCIVEKPVGSDIGTSEAIKKEFTGCFEEESIYLLDHYLGKEAVRNIYYLRYANPILERLFKNTLINHVEITASEPGGLEGRAGYFESVGTFRDMFQSHLLMIASLLTMRFSDDESSVEHNRLDALRQFYIPPTADLGDVVLQGQYSSGTVKDKDVCGYLEEDGVDNESRTNTYAALRLMSRMSRWQGVPFYLRSGKRLQKKETRISIEFQEPRKVGEGSAPNRLDVILQGEAGMRVHLQTKMGGTDPQFRPLILEDPLVCVGDCLPEHSLLLLEAIHGKKEWYLTFEEVQSAWRLIDPLQAYLDQESTPLYEYQAGTMGPEEADEWIERDGVKWVEG